MTVLELAAALVGLPAHFHHCQVVIDDHGDQLIAETLRGVSATRAASGTVAIEITGNVLKDDFRILFRDPKRLADNAILVLAEQLDPNNGIPPLPLPEPFGG